MRKMKSHIMVFDLDAFNLEDFREYIIFLFDNNQLYDFQIGIRYYIGWCDSNSISLGHNVPFKLLSLDDKEGLIVSLYNKIYKSLKDSERDLGRFVFDNWGERKYMKILCIFIDIKLMGETRC